MTSGCDISPKWVSEQTFLKGLSSFYFWKALDYPYLRLELALRQNLVREATMFRTYLSCHSNSVAQK